MKLYTYRVYNLTRQNLVNSGYFYAKSRDTMRARVAREFVGYEVTVSETTEKPTDLKDVNGKSIGIKFKETPKYIGKVLSLSTLTPTWYSADGDAYSFNKNTGKLYGKKRRL